MQVRQGLEGRKGRNALQRCGTQWSNGGGSRNPGKPIKNGLLAIFYDGFSGENPRAVMQRFDAPSMALFVLKKWEEFLWGTFVAQVKAPQ